MGLFRQKFLSKIEIWNMDVEMEDSMCVTDELGVFDRILNYVGDGNELALALTCKTSMELILAAKRQERLPAQSVSYFMKHSDALRNYARDNLSIMDRLPETRFLSIMNWASRSHRIEVIKWLRSQNPTCPWSSSTAAMAAQAGDLKILHINDHHLH